MTDEQCIAIMAAVLKAADMVRGEVYDSSRAVHQDGYSWPQWTHDTWEESVESAKQLMSAVRETTTNPR